MKEILKFKKINELKKVYRSNSVGTRKESSAEHTWSSLMLADYFFPKISQKVDKLKVYELLMYHDLVEIESGDFALSPDIEELNKKEIELKGAKVLSKKLTKYQSNKFLNLFMEFEDNLTIEAKFATAIDKFDAIIQELDYKEDWKGWKKEFLQNKKEIFFKDFPIINREFHKILNYLEKENYFH